MQKPPEDTPTPPDRDPAAQQSGTHPGPQDARHKQFLAENQAAIEDWNAEQAEHGLPLTPHRLF